MDDFAGLMLGGIDAPDLLETDSISLGLRFLSELVLLDGELGERPVCAFGKQGDFGVERHAGLKVGFGSIVPG